jgi:hypothetical protein
MIRDPGHEILYGRIEVNDKIQCRLCWCGCDDYILKIYNQGEYEGGIQYSLMNMKFDHLWTTSQNIDELEVCSNVDLPSLTWMIPRDDVDTSVVSKLWERIVKIMEYLEIHQTDINSKKFILTYCTCTEYESMLEAHYSIPRLKRPTIISEKSPYIMISYNE